MGKGIFHLLFVLFFASAVAGAVPKAGVATSVDKAAIACVSNTYLHEVGVRELTGHNDGVRVGQYLHTVGLGQGYSWCSAFVKWCLLQCNVPNNITAWSPSANNANHLVYAKGRFYGQPKPGDVFCLYSQSQHRIHHTGFYHQYFNGTWYVSVEGNTNDNGSANGDGVYKRKRTYRSTWTISRWIES